MMKVIKNFQGGLSTTLSSVNIDDDEFSELTNMFCYRGSLVPKFGNNAVGALTTTQSSSSFTTLDASGNGSFNVLTGLPITAYVSSQSLLLSDGVNSYSQSSTLDGTLTTSGTASGTINYATGAITITGGAPNAVVSGSVSVCLGLPVMGIANQLAGTANTPIIWDTSYSYTYDPNADIKLSYNSTYQDSGNTCQWHGQDYELFSYANFGASLFCSNGVAGMQLKAITAITLGATTTITIANHGLVANDYVWLNEIVGTTQLNGVTAQVLSIPTANTFVVNVNSTGYTAYSSGGIAQYLTNGTALPDKDGLRYFTGTGWVNYAPPVNPFVAGSSTPVQYVCGCTSMLVFKGRLLLFGVYVATSAQALAGTYTLLPSTMFYSSIYGINFGSPYYTSLNPINAVNAGAFYAFPAGVYGGNIDFGTGQPILGAIDWKLDYVFITFFSYRLRLYSTASPVTPFAYTRISSQYGGCNYKSAVSLDEAIFDLSAAGFVASTATNVQRFDTDIISLYLSVSLQNNGQRRVVSYNDPSIEVIYFTYSNSSNANVFPDTTLLYNYRNNTWALLDTSYTCYGLLPNLVSGFADQEIQYMTKLWSQYTEPWDFQGVGTGVTYGVAGNQCGYVLDIGYYEGGYNNDYSLPISSINGSSFGINNHNLVVGQVLKIEGCVGVTGVNGGFYKVATVVNQSEVTLDITGNSGTYLGLGVAAVVDTFSVKTKDFNDGIGKGTGICIGNLWLQLATSSSQGAPFSVSAFASTAKTSTSSFGSPEKNGYIPIYLPEVSSAVDSFDGYNEDQSDQEWLWKEVIVNCTGSSVSLLVTRTADQIIKSQTAPAPITINCLAFKMSATSRLVN